MRSQVGAGVLGGLIAGTVFGAMMQMMNAPTPEGGQMPMMAMVAQVVGSDKLIIGWLYHLFNSAVIGAIFGWIAGNGVRNYGAGLLWGALYGVVWWVVGALILMPVFLGQAPFAPLNMPPMRPVAIGSLMGHVIYGLVLGAAYVGLRGPATTETVGHRRTVA
jgi:hypothetical protein